MTTYDAVAEALFPILEFEPTGSQEPILRSRKRFILVSGGEQSGKSVSTAVYLVIRYPDDMVDNPGQGDGRGPPLLYWLVAKDYEGTRREFEYLAEHLTKLGLPIDASKRIDPGYITLKYPDERQPRVRIETKSARDPRSLRMFAPNGILGCEASQLELETYHRLQTRLGPKRGWLFMSGTMEGSLGWYPGLVTAWAAPGQEAESFILPSSSNVYMYPGGESDPEIQRLKRELPDDTFQERMMGIPCPPRGLVFPEVRADVHVREVEWVPDEPVHLWEDPGYNHAHAILAVQVIGGQIRVFDEIYEVGRTTEDLIDHIVAWRPWWKARDWPGIHLVSDPKGKDQHHSTNSVGEIWLEKTGLVARGEKVGINEGTERFKTFLKIDPLSGEPGVVFSPNCQGILSELGLQLSPLDGQRHVYRWDTDREGNIIGQTPKNMFNDSIKAFIYGCVERFGYVRRERRDRIPVKRW